MKDKFAQLKQIDESLKSSKFLQPVQGWIRTIRKTLGVTIKQLANRLGCHPSRVVKIEMDELTGSVSMRTMMTVADKLDCDFVYRLVPRTSLENIIKNRAREIASDIVRRTAHTMDLEAQSVEKQWIEEQINTMTNEILQKSWKNLWEE